MDPGLVVPTRFQPDAARDAVVDLLDRRPDVTALFAANNMLAEGGFQALRHCGRSVPDDLSMVAFDDVPWMSMVSPGITTVDQHTDDLGRACAQLVVDRIAGSAAGRGDGPLHRAVADRPRAPPPRRRPDPAPSGPAPGPERDRPHWCISDRTLDSERGPKIVCTALW